MKKVFESPSDLSEYLFRIVDNGGSSFDRYTVVFSDGSFLALSHNPTSPQGFSQSGDYIDPATLEKWVEEGDSVDLALGDLPPGLVDHILYRCNEGLADFLKDVENREPHAVAKNRDAADENDGTHDSVGKGIYHTEEGYRIRLEGDPSDDRGPYATAREAVLASLPDQYSLSGPEYHTTTELMRLEPHEEVTKAIAELEAKRDAEWEKERSLGR
jgi:hypothetical protein